MEGETFYTITTTSGKHLSYHSSWNNASDRLEKLKKERRNNFGVHDFEEGLDWFSYTLGAWDGTFVKFEIKMLKFED